MLLKFVNIYNSIISSCKIKYKVFRYVIIAFYVYKTETKLNVFALILKKRKEKPQKN